MLIGAHSNASWNGLLTQQYYPSICFNHPMEACSTTHSETALYIYFGVYLASVPGLPHAGFGTCSMTPGANEPMSGTARWLLMKHRPTLVKTRHMTCIHVIKGRNTVCSVRYKLQKVRVVY